MFFTIKMLAYKIIKHKETVISLSVVILVCYVMIIVGEAVTKVIEKEIEKCIDTSTCNVINTEPLFSWWLIPVSLFAFVVVYILSRGYYLGGTYDR